MEVPNIQRYPDIFHYKIALLTVLTVCFILLITILPKKEKTTQNVLLFSLHLDDLSQTFFLTSIRCSKVKAERFFGGILFHSWFINN